MGILIWPCDVRTIYITIYKAEVIEHPFPPEMGVEITCASNIRNEQTLHGHNILIL